MIHLLCMKILSCFPSYLISILLIICTYPYYSYRPLSVLSGVGDGRWCEHHRRQVLQERYSLCGFPHIRWCTYSTVQLSRANTTLVTLLSLLLLLSLYSLLLCLALPLYLSFPLNIFSLFILSSFSFPLFHSLIHTLIFFQAQKMLDDPTCNDKVGASVKLLNKLARILRQRRIDEGALTLASPEVRDILPSLPLPSSPLPFLSPPLPSLPFLLSCGIILCTNLSCLVLSCLVLSCLVLSSLVLSRSVLSYPILPCTVLSYHNYHVNFTLAYFSSLVMCCDFIISTTRLVPYHLFSFVM